MAATSSDIIDALLQFSEGVTTSKRRRRRSSNNINIYHPPMMPVPNPLDPTQPHLIEDVPLGSGSKSTFTSAQLDDDDNGAHVVITSSSVPNPLATPGVDKPLLQQQSLPIVSAVKALAYLSTSQDKKQLTSHGFKVTPSIAPLPAPSKVIPTLALPEKISTALNSKPQRGRKRDNLSEEVRIELTKARNREHARNTRMKKKARFQELSDIEATYSVMKERESLDLRRRQHLNDFVKNASAAGETNKCIHSSKLVKLASQVLLKPEFSVDMTSVCTSTDTALVKVSARGTTVDLESTQKTLPGVISVNFIPTSASVDICDVSLYWQSSSLPENITPSSTGSSSLQPSVSVLSFET